MNGGSERAKHDGSDVGQKADGPNRRRRGRLHRPALEDMVPTVSKRGGRPPYTARLRAVVSVLPDSRPPVLPRHRRQKWVRLQRELAFHALFWKLGRNEYLHGTSQRKLEPVEGAEGFDRCCAWHRLRLH